MCIPLMLSNTKVGDKELPESKVAALAVVPEMPSEVHFADETIRLGRADLRERGINEEFDRIVKVVSLMKGRVNFVHELWDTCSYFFEAPESYDEKSLKKWWKEPAVSNTYVSELCHFIEQAPVFAGAEIEPLIMEWIASKEWPVGKVMNAFRVTLVGAAVGPHIFELTDFIGKEETLRRARRALEVLPQA